MVVVSVTDDCIEIIMEREDHSRRETDTQMEGDSSGIRRHIFSFFYLSGKAPVVIVTAVSSALAPDKEAIEGSGKGEKR